MRQQTFAEGAFELHYKTTRRAAGRRHVDHARPGVRDRGMSAPSQFRSSAWTFKSSSATALSAVWWVAASTTLGA